MILYRVCAQFGEIELMEFCLAGDPAIRANHHIADKLKFGLGVFDKIIYVDGGSNLRDYVYGY